MDFLSPDLPEYISILFLVIIPLPMVLMANLVSKYKGKNMGHRIILFYLVYLILVSIGSFQGIFDKNRLPPTIVLMTTIPLATFYFVIIYKRKWLQDFLAKVQLAELVELHIFRIIGSFFLILTFYKVLPSTIGLIAGIGDLIAAFGSLWVASALRKSKSASRKLCYAWNTFGFLDIVIAMSLALILTYRAMNFDALGVEVLATFPFCIIPAFAPSTIIFLHFLIYRKLKLTAKV